MPAKTPMYLKTSTPKRGKKTKLRDMLSREMISPPLGDFRHSAHIGLDGEGGMFGELSFLQGKYDLLPNLGHKLAIQSADAGLDGDLRSGPESYRPFLKNAVSLPAFGDSQHKERAPPKPPRLHLEETPSQRSMSVSYGEGGFHREEDLSFSTISQDEHSRFLAASMSSSDGSISECGGESRGQESEEAHHARGSPRAREQSLTKSDSLFGLELDLGPSILDEVLRIMDDYKA
ncbi:cdc42 effector protein 2-like [Spea bombifrons]|uniref:cdc42 effector protein 2-like n=1 Tax=Spea bombifrons TaxID=233779 RepID=UPI00234A8293|nr:cdc42 effector protein 2-like [Spea bombifrons]